MIVILVLLFWCIHVVAPPACRSSVQEVGVKVEHKEVMKRRRAVTRFTAAPLVGATSNYIGLSNLTLGGQHPILSPSYHSCPTQMEGSGRGTVLTNCVMLCHYH